MSNTFMPEIPKLLRSWRLIDKVDEAGACYMGNTGLRVLITGAYYPDNKRWIHVSLSKKNELPTYEDMVMVKDAFIGKDKKAIQVFPPEAEHVNIHPYCLHLWSCIDEDPLPDFRLITGMI